MSDDEEYSNSNRDNDDDNQSISLSSSGGGSSTGSSGKFSSSTESASAGSGSNSTGTRSKGRYRDLPEELAAKEEKLVTYSRYVVFTVLSLLAILAAILTYHFGAQEEIGNFEDQVRKRERERERMFVYLYFLNEVGGAKSRYQLSHPLISSLLSLPRSSSASVY